VQANRASTGNRYLVLIGTDTSTWFDSSEKNSGTFPDAMHEWITGPGADESCGAGTVVLDNQTIGRVDSCPGSAAQNASAAFEARDFDGQVVEYHSEPDLGSWGQAGVATWSATGRGYAFGYQELTLVDLDRGTREVAGASTAGEYEGLCFGQRNSGSIFWHNRIVCGG
jgi:hypothetical protein